MHPELIGDNIALVPLDDTHFDTLQRIALSNTEVYRYTTRVETAPAFARWFVKAQAENAWTVIHRRYNQPIGSTRIYNTSQEIAMTTIGYTWYAPEYRGKGINDEAKLLLLTYIFETLKFNRVTFEINAENVVSRKAVEKLGARLEGVFHQVRRNLDGSLADGAFYALLASDWDNTKKQLQQKLEAQ